MTLLTVLKDLKSKDIKLWVEGESLHFDAPPGAMSADLQARITTHKPEIIKILGRTKKQNGIEPISRDQPLPLSYAQEGVWYLEQINPNTTSYNMIATWQIDGEFDEPALVQALRKITARHETLRTAIQMVDDQPILSIQQEGQIDYECVDLTMVVSLRQTAAIEQWIKQEKATPFDLSKSPLLRTKLLRLAPTKHILILSMHHIIGDAWSFSLLFRELEAIYGEINPLPKLPIQYADFAAWQRKKLENVKEHADINFWTKTLADAAPLLELPTDYPRPAVLEYEGDTIRAKIPSKLTAKLNALNKAKNVTPFMVLLAAFKILMQRYSGQDDIIVGTPMVNRSRIETENLIGYFLNNLALRSDLSGNPTFQELVDRIRACTLNAYSHQDVPFERIVQVLDPPRDLSYSPIFQVFFNMTTGNMEDDLSLKGAKVKTYTSKNSEHGSKFDFTLYLNQLESHINLRLVFKTSLFKRERMQQLIDQYLFLLEQALAEPDRQISSLSILTPAAKQLLPNPTASLLADWHGPVHEAVSRHAELAPDQIAVSDPNVTWSYKDLEARSNRLAHYLIEHGVKQGDIIGIYGHRSAPLVWAWLGVLKAGAAFVNLDPAYPVERLQHYLNVSKPVGLIHIPAAGPMPQELVSFAKQSKRFVSLEHKKLFAQYPSTPPAISIDPDDTAYIAFTSGSTGKPKGVRGRHGPLSHFLPWQIKEFRLSDRDRFSMLSGLSHDPLQRDIFTAFWAGGTLHIPDPEQIGIPHYLASWMAEQKITFSHMTPPMCQILTESSQTETKLPDLRYVFFVGDKLTRQDIGRLQNIAPNVTGINSYGSTETQRAVGYHLIPPNADQTSNTHSKAVYPLGQGMPNVQLLVLNQQRQLAGICESGEIYVRSPHLAGGYLGDESLSAARFMTNPFTGDLSDRLYRTGDLGYYRPDGLVEFNGRADRQFKIRGFRVDPGEIEYAIAEHPSIQDATVIAIQGKTEWSNALAAYYTTADGKPVDGSALKNLVSNKLPSHMLPATFTHLVKVPLTPNGKIDYRALPRWFWQSADRAELTATATSETEAQLVTIWKELLELEQINIHDSFFELGGHSLLAIRLFNRIFETFGTQLPLTSLFQYPSISQLAILIDFNRHEETAESSSTTDIANKLLIPIQVADKSNKPPLYCIHGFGGGVVGYGEMARLLGDGQTVYGLQAIGHDGLDEPDDTIEKMAARYIESIRQIQPNGPYHLSGYCYGGVVAFEMARQLEEQGELVPMVGIFEGYAPLRGGNRDSIWRNPKLIVHWFRNFPFWFSDFLNLGQKQMSRRLRRRLKRVWQRCAAVVGRQVSLNPEDVVDDTAELADHQLELMKVHLQALRRYDPAAYNGRISLFRIRSQALSRTTDKTMGWHKLASGVDVTMIKGSHNNILEQPHVQSLAAGLRDSLKKIS